MTGRIITHANGRKFHVGGWKPRANRGPRLRLANYLDMTKFTTPAPDCDYTVAAAAGLSDVLLNDQLGDCTCAGVGHAIDLVNCNAASIVRVTDAQILALYEAACGYVDGDPSTDQGGDEIDVLDYVSEKGLDGHGLHQFMGSVIVDATNKLEVRWAQWALGNTYFGEGLPTAYVQNMPSGPGFTWGVEGSSDPSNGHCFVGCGSNATGIKICTWGMLGLQTYDAVAKYAASSGGGELHTILTTEWLNSASQKTPSGFALSDLVADLKRIGSLSQ